MCLKFFLGDKTLLEIHLRECCTCLEAMASTSKDSQEHELAGGFSKFKVTILGSEWGSSKGGISTISRELAIQLAKFPEVEITVFLLRCSEEDKNQALLSNVRIVEAKEHLGFDKLDWLCFPPEDLQIDVIVGHGVKLGHQVQVIKNSKKCKWVQVVHTDPEEQGMFKSHSDSITKGQEMHSIEMGLCEMADLVVGIGPKLSESVRSYLRSCQKDQSVVDFTPGVIDEFTSVKQSPEERKPRSILVFGWDEDDEEDFESKGFDIAARAVATVPDTRLVFVGAPDGKHKEIKEKLTDCRVPTKNVRVRGIVQSREKLKRLFLENDLVLMPSRTEGFGLTGLEALSAGLPVLVSCNSGFGEALSKVPFGSSFVIDSEDPEVWAAKIKKVWGKDRQGRLKEAETLRTSYEGKYSWGNQSRDLLGKMISLLNGMTFSYLVAEVV